jgi:hypothetical protein
MLEPREHDPMARSRVDARVGNRLIEVKTGLGALRTVRVNLYELAHRLSREPEAVAFLVYPDATVTEERMRGEWQLASMIVRPELFRRMTLCIGRGEGFVCIPRVPDAETLGIIADVVGSKRAGHAGGVAKGDAWFVVTKVLLHHRLLDDRPVTTRWLTQVSGFSYPTVAAVLRSLGSLVERSSDRRIRLRWFAHDLLARLSALSDRARSTLRFADRTGRERAPEEHVARLERLGVDGVALGGVLAARHRVPTLDISGAPRLDVSVHRPGRALTHDWIQRLDPGLGRVHDPLAPASVVLHAVRHADPLFTSREGGLAWVDPIECLLDLREAGLEPQARQFLAALGERGARA